MSQHEPSPTSSGVSLQAHVEELRSRCEAVSRLQGGSTYLYEEIGIFLDYLRERGLFLESPPEELSRPPDDEGNEHQVWFLRHEESVLKATWPDFFGLLVVHRPGEESRASPIDYLQRWTFHNDLFGDDISFVGALQTDAGLRLSLSGNRPSRASRPPMSRLPGSSLRPGGSASPLTATSHSSIPGAASPFPTLIAATSS